MSERKPQTEDKYVIRFPDGLRNRIKKAAEHNNRSINAEIITTLEEKYPPSDEGAAQEMIQLFSQLTPENQQRFIAYIKKKDKN